MSTATKTEITVPKSVRRKAGFKAGEPVSFKVSDRAITIVPRLTPAEVEDEREVGDPKVRRVIKQGYLEFVAGKGRPIEQFFAERDAAPKRRRRKA